ncbi:MAG: hypothetical protein ACRENI_14880 [Gemmatimonadaceae bacterium]
MTGLRAPLLPVLFTVVFSACEPGQRPLHDASDSGVADSSTASDSIDGLVRLARERLQDMTGDGEPERFTVAARGPRMDSLGVVLEIHSSDGNLLYQDAWNSRLYFQYVDRDEIPDSTAERQVQEHIEALLADDSFRPTPQVRPNTPLLGEAEMREAIRYSTAEAIWREQHGLPVADTLPHAAFGKIGVISVPAARVDRLFREISAKPSFSYFAGGEATYAIVWSEAEQRFVTVFACC